MDDRIKETDLCSDSNNSTFQPRSTTALSRAPMSARNPTLAHSNFYRAAGMPNLRRTPSSSFEDDFVNIDSPSFNHEPRQRLGSMQPSTGFRMPRGMSRATEFNHPVETPTPVTSPTSAKRKRNHLVSSFHTPSRGNSVYRDDTDAALGSKRRTTTTPPSSASSGTRTLASEFPTPVVSEPSQDLESLTATLNTLARTITDMPKQYQKPMMDLARKVNTLTDRLAVVEEENASLRAHVDHTMESFAQQTSKRMRDLEEKHQEMIDVVDLQISAHQPVAGGAYGGPASTQPNRQPGVFHDMFSNNPRAGQRP
ncbi:hypothetical protein LTR36_005885 [Oleoguttula mirabilis]|uniref:Uncharacterized protein n=1 Tax=Oleoguttula mirabilis TaxID=1507867 RepID=A0AAV9JD78_9PEZI|nr:hypothetical protein LTR36_005885 [Oleoguttula mirabilis]